METQTVTTPKTESNTLADLIRSILPFTGSGKRIEQPRAADWDSIPAKFTETFDNQQFAVLDDALRKYNPAEGWNKLECIRDEALWASLSFIWKYQDSNQGAENIDVFPEHIVEEMIESLLTAYRLPR